ncbi:undecaprenyldiphospho-muramoylpentapeptide beta-N-acetylglucosaminyltransferase [Kistimonas asteriae]|uniref:undecaprenyldiphospho-muramoylpentapeptide beta-N-acetylglucosaminyltransferase n=1 Tax=Kistimonas asteriae TaxID=517724 RepID=UPI001BA7387B|nr:undecaprenyldiphospho-muramoylpentapeptide beta-N-acetylglucosaminyltransferase [Kistimonas asteriae]
MTEQGKPVFVIMAGGTGGHIFPALAVAEALQAQGYGIHWLGTRDGMESTLVPAHGFDISYMPVKGIMGNGMRAILQAPFRVTASVLKAIRVMRSMNVVGVLGMGGFASGPGGVAAKLLGIPLVIHEQNAVPGFTNKIASRFASRVLEAFPGTFDVTDKAIFTGNPVRNTILPESEDNARAGPLKLLVLGGSRGALAINECIPAAMALAKAPVEVWHQTGAGKVDETQAIYEHCGVTGRVEPFIDDMGAAYRWADIIVCRSGALTVAELANAGKPAILVPYPWHKDQQQLRNARYLVDRGAAVLLEQSELSDVKLAELLDKYAQERELLSKMREAALGCARPEATATVAQQCREVALG